MRDLPSSDASCPVSRCERVLKSALALGDAVAAGDVDGVLKAEAAYQCAFVSMRDGTEPALGPSQAALLLDTAERVAAFLRTKMAGVEAELGALRSWRRCLAGYRLPDGGAARFVNRQS